MRRPENLAVPIPEEEKLTQDKKYWWEWLQKEKRKLSYARYGTQLSVVGEKSEFSSKVDNKSLAIMLAKMEALRYSEQYHFDFDRKTPFSKWPEEIKVDIKTNRGFLKPLLTQMESENWTFEDLAQAHVKSIAESFGFESRYCMFRLGSKEVLINRSIAIGAYLLKQLMEQRKWGREIDALIVTSAVLPADLSLLIVEFAREMGFLDHKPKIELRDVRIACSGSNVAQMMATKDPLINSKEKVAILSLDPLGDMMGLYEKGWSFDRPQLPQFSNGFVAMGVKANEWTLVPGSVGMFSPDETRFIHYYDVLPDNPTLSESLRRRIADPNKLLSFFSLIPGHIAAVIKLPFPNEEGVPVEEGRHFDYTRPIVTTFPIIIKQFKESLGDEFDQSLLFSTRSHRRISELWRKLLLKHGQVEEPVDFEPVGNSSSATLPGSMLQESPKNRWNSKNAKTLFWVSTGIGASIVIAAYILGKRNK